MGNLLGREFAKLKEIPQVGGLPPVDKFLGESLSSLILGAMPITFHSTALPSNRRSVRRAWLTWEGEPVSPKEMGREETIDSDSEAKLLAVGKQPMKDVLIITQDTGLRPEEVFRIRVENIDRNRLVIFNPHGKTRAARRYVPISRRVSDLLMLRCEGKKMGWLFPSKRSSSGHLTTVAKQFREARRSAGLPGSLVLYCARHTFGTAVYESTGNLAMVMKVMGPADAGTAMQYRHPALDPIRAAIDQRNSRHNLRHSEYLVQ